MINAQQNQVLVDTPKTANVSMTEKQKQRFIAIACVSFFPLLYIVGKMLTSM